MNRTILIYSGGLDSTVLLYDLVAKGSQVKCISFDYGQRHKKELESASYFCSELGVEHKKINLECIKQLISNSCLTSDEEVPEGHYAEESMKSTVVPNRNMIMLSIAGGWAINEKYDSVSYAAHGGDHAIYPDCREEFVNAASLALSLADWHKVSIDRPFVGISKSDIVKIGSSLNIGMDKTWSCYKGGLTHCGKCGTCVERIEAFKNAGVEDKTIYENLH